MKALTRLAIANYTIHSANEVGEDLVHVVQASKDGNDVGTWVRVFLRQHRREERSQGLKEPLEVTVWGDQATNARAGGMIPTYLKGM